MKPKVLGSRTSSFLTTKSNRATSRAKQTFRKKQSMKKTMQLRTSKIRWLWKMNMDIRSSTKICNTSPKKNCHKPQQKEKRNKNICCPLKPNPNVCDQDHDLVNLDRRTKRKGKKSTSGCFKNAQNAER